MEQQQAHGQHILMRALVDELARCGVADACTSPGSRSTPLVVPLARDLRIRSWSHVDERSGAFFALGLAKATGRPVVLGVHVGHRGGQLRARPSTRPTRPACRSSS
jgi:2-succinyl-5-enolpyruvyl-6-hydroxy-3-cyclohexene-1-carboxylate synthase